jgi:hypothetical protein
MAANPAAQERLDIVNKGRGTNETIVGGNELEYNTSSGGSISKIFSNENGKVSIKYIYQDAKTTKLRRAGSNFLSNLAFHYDNGTE